MTHGRDRIQACDTKYHCRAQRSATALHRHCVQACGGSTLQAQRHQSSGRAQGLRHRSWVVTHDLGSQMLQMDDPSESMCGYC
jgi:hypothetical protein